MAGKRSAKRCLEKVNLALITKKSLFREIEISVFSENVNLKISVEEESLLTTNSHITQVDYIIFTNLLLLVLFWREICIKTVDVTFFTHCLQIKGG